MHSMIWIGEKNGSKLSADCPGGLQEKRKKAESDIVEDTIAGYGMA